MKCSVMSVYDGVIENLAIIFPEETVSEHRGVSSFLPAHVTFRNCLNVTIAHCPFPEIREIRLA